MESVVIKMSKEHYEAEKDIRNLIRYIAAEGKNKKNENLLCFKTRGTSGRVDEAIEQMIAVQGAYEKTNKRRMYHLIVSFPKEIKDKAVVKECADRIAGMLFQKYQVVYGIHISKSNWHIHYAINAVSYRDGKKWHQSKAEFAEWKKEVLEIMNDVFRKNGYKKYKI